VKIILFAKPVFADMSTDFYKHELHKYACIDPWGNAYESSSFGLKTLSGPAVDSVYEPRSDHGTAHHADRPTQRNRLL